MLQLCTYLMVVNITQMANTHQMVVMYKFKHVIVIYIPKYTSNVNCTGSKPVIIHQMFKCCIILICTMPTL